MEPHLKFRGLKRLAIVASPVTALLFLAANVGLGSGSYTFIGKHFGIFDQSYERFSANVLVFVFGAVLPFLVLTAYKYVLRGFEEGNGEEH